MKKLHYSLIIIVLLSVSCLKSSETEISSEITNSFSVDPFWPKPLPNNWLIGQVAGVAVDSKDHIWIIQRPGSLGEDETATQPSESYPYDPAPPVMEFDPEGHLIQAWGGSGKDYEWPETEHGLFIDHSDNVWINGGGTGNHQVLKFTRDGKFLLAIGEPGKTGGNNDTALMGFPTEFYVDQNSNEIFISDGYVNNRIIVFDANTGKYKRHWGAYGYKPEDEYHADSLDLNHFNTPHSIQLSNDGLVYVADRGNNRIQVFEKDGTYVSEAFIARETTGYGSTWSLDFSHDPEQTFIYIADGTNQRVWILERKNLEKVGHFGRMGRYAGQFIWLHNVAVDSKGNIYTGEVFTGKRIQKFVQTDL